MVEDLKKGQPEVIALDKKNDTTQKDLLDI